MRLEDELKQREFSNDYHKGIVNIIYTFNWIDSHSSSFFKNYDLTPQQYNILRILRGQHPKPSTINLLKERMLDKMCDASRIVERLRLKNLLVRTPCANDRRSVDIMISKKGLDLLDTIDKDMEKFLSIMHNLNSTLTHLMF
ncbi:MAG: MarR family transcriptional regulator [Cytophagaceae bacterium]|nr:MarR family transcriptional regulator [Cytophagaceae bacterium]